LSLIGIEQYSYAEERGIPTIVAKRRGGAWLSTVVAKRLNGPRCHLVKT